jgi:hypothetical protein
MQHPVDRLPRILLLRTPVNEDEKEDRSPSLNPSLARTGAPRCRKPANTISQRLETI